MKKRTHMVVIVTALAGCSLPSNHRDRASDPAPGDDGATGRIQAAMTSVPAGVTCLQIVLSGSTSATELFTVTAGQSSTVSLGPLKPGSVSITANAFNLSCGAVSKISVPSWLSDPTDVTVSAGLVSNVILTLRPNAPTTATVDFAVPALDVAAGAEFTVALMSDGTLRAWGSNSSGQVGDGTSVNRNTPVAVSGIANAIQVAAGGDHACALLANGTARCWGTNGNGQLGNGTTTPSSTPTAVTMPAGVTFTQISAGLDYTCAVGSDGFAWCWGLDDSGQLGDCTTNDAHAPRRTNVSSVDQVAAGGGFACARLKDGRVTCWGDNTFGQFGDGGDSSPPTCPKQTSYFPVVAFGAGGHSSCALYPTGSVSCAGDNTFGEIGDGSGALQQPSPTPVSLPADATSISVGLVHACVVRTGGSLPPLGLVSCWGNDEGGQLGDGTATARQSTPVDVLGLTGVTSVSAGYFHTCARKGDGSVWCWGRNDDGRLGDRTNTWRFTPVKVAL